MSKVPYESRPTRIACIQHSCVESKTQNIERAVKQINEAIRQDVDIVCLQELFASPYFPAHRMSRNKAIHEHAETLPGPLTNLLCDISKKTKIVIVGGSIYERATGDEKGKFYNSSPIIDSGEIIAVHRKAHIPNDPGYTERTFFSEGSQAVTVAETSKGKIGVGICFDQWFPEVASMASRQGTEVLLYPTAIGETDEEVVGGIEGDNGFWHVKLQNALRGQASMGNMYVGMANRIGVEGDTRFFGGSALYNPNGQTLKQLGQRQEGILVEECDLGKIQALKDVWMFNDLRRPDIYKEA